MWPPEAQVWTIQKVNDQYVNNWHIYCHFNNIQLLWYDHPIHVILISQIPYKKFKHLYMYMYTCYISEFSIFLVYNFHFVLI